MNFWNRVGGSVRLELTSGDPPETMYLLSQQGIMLSHIVFRDTLTVRFQCRQQDKENIVEICGKRGDRVRVLRETGCRSWIKSAMARPLLTGGILFFLAMSLFLPTRILFFQVEGNEILTQRQILAAAESCGIGFGVSRRSVRSEKMKNSLLAALPELKWAGINTSGCRAVISVRERPEPQMPEESAGVGSIVAVRDGFVTSCTVFRGSALCEPGQVVRKGQVLISGYTDCGICIQATRAEGEIYAQTNRQIRVITPMKWLQRYRKKNECRRYSLILGKKRINFWKDSGISDTTCGRMYEEYYITLPGGFRLPVCLGVETLTQWETRMSDVPQETVEAGICGYARELILQQMRAGRILQESYAPGNDDGILRVDAGFLCSEMIGRFITEEIGETNGKTD